MQNILLAVKEYLNHQSEMDSPDDTAERLSEVSAWEGTGL